jgi:hypothetical protein
MKSNPIIQNPFIRRFLPFLMGLFLMLISSCSMIATEEPLPPTSTPTQTQSPTPTIDWFPATPTPTLQAIQSPTPQPTLAMEQEGVTSLLIEDNFTDANLWLLFQSSAGNAAFGDQNLTLAVAKPGVSLISESQHVLPEDFYLEITVENALCQPSDRYGFDFWRQSAGDFYRLVLTCAGEYRLILVQGGQSIVVRNWETASQIQLTSPAINQIGLWVHDGRFQLFINDTFQFEEGISRNRSGELALYAETVSSTAMTVQFFDLKIYRVVMD